MVGVPHPRCTEAQGIKSNQIVQWWPDELMPEFVMAGWTFVPRNLDHPEIMRVSLNLTPKLTCFSLWDQHALTYSFISSS